MAKKKSQFRCTACGHVTAKWVGRCAGCEAWNTLEEEAVSKAPAHEGQAVRSFRLPESEQGRPMRLSEVKAQSEDRMATGYPELDRVLGGGLVPGALVLVGGDPGIGKSTLLLAALSRIAEPGGDVIYVTGEESAAQVKLRADRMGVVRPEILLLPETRVDRVVDAIERVRPRAVVLDSVQSMYDPRLDSTPGSVGQVKEVTARFLYLAKSLHIPTFLVGHVTKEGGLAGPRILEHMVDTVLYFESEKSHPYRILRAHKNRFGSTQEIGVFEMRGEGLVEVENPSGLFLAERAEGAPGSAVFAALEGTRPLLVEIQALVSPTNHGTPRRTCLGFEGARAAMLIAVLERRVGLDLLGCDIFVNVAGGLRLDDPAADLAVSLALASSLRNRALSRRLVSFGEVGLSGELRAVQQPQARLIEAEKLGFGAVVMPPRPRGAPALPKGLQATEAKTLEDAVAAVLEG